MSSTPPGIPSDPADPLRLWAEFLAAQRLRSTGPRRQILEGIAASPGHFDAETLRLRLKGKGRRLSRATIYRTLALLAESGLLRKLQLGEGALHYELARPNDIHHHLVCRSCGGVQEIPDGGLHRVVADLARRASFAPEALDLRIRGLCARCRDRGVVQDAL